MSVQLYALFFVAFVVLPLLSFLRSAAIFRGGGNVSRFLRTGETRQELLLDHVIRVIFVTCLAVPNTFWTYRRLSRVDWASWMSWGSSSSVGAMCGGNGSTGAGTQGHCSATTATHLFASSSPTVSSCETTSLPSNGSGASSVFSFLHYLTPSSIPTLYLFGACVFHAFYLYFIHLDQRERRLEKKRHNVSLFNRALNFFKHRLYLPYVNWKCEQVRRFFSLELVAAYGPLPLFVFPTDENTAVLREAEDRKRHTLELAAATGTSLVMSEGEKHLTAHPPQLRAPALSLRSWQEHNEQNAETEEGKQRHATSTTQGGGNDDASSQPRTPLQPQCTEDMDLKTPMVRQETAAALQHGTTTSSSPWGLSSTPPIHSALANGVKKGGATDVIEGEDTSGNATSDESSADDWDDEEFAQLTAQREKRKQSIKKQKKEDAKSAAAASSKVATVAHDENGKRQDGDKEHTAHSRTGRDTASHGEATAVTQQGTKPDARITPLDPELCAADTTTTATTTTAEHRGHHQNHNHNHNQHPMRTLSADSGARSGGSSLHLSSDSHRFSVYSAEGEDGDDSAEQEPPAVLHRAQYFFAAHPHGILPACSLVSLLSNVMDRDRTLFVDNRTFSATMSPWVAAPATTTPSATSGSRNGAPTPKMSAALPPVVAASLLSLAGQSASSSVDGHSGAASTGSPVLLPSITDAQRPATVGAPLDDGPAVPAFTPAPWLHCSPTSESMPTPRGQSMHTLPPGTTPPQGSPLLPLLCVQPPFGPSLSSTGKEAAGSLTTAPSPTAEAEEKAAEGSPSEQWSSGHGSFLGSSHRDGCGLLTTAVPPPRTSSGFTMTLASRLMYPVTSPTSAPLVRPASETRGGGACEHPQGGDQSVPYRFPPTPNGSPHSPSERSARTAPAQGEGSRGPSDTAPATTMSHLLPQTVAGSSRRFSSPLMNSPGASSSSGFFSSTRAPAAQPPPMVPRYAKARHYLFNEHLGCFVLLPTRDEAVPPVGVAPPRDPQPPTSSLKIRLRAVVATFPFYVPIMREVYMFHGMLDASYDTCKRVLLYNNHRVKQWWKKRGSRLGKSKTPEPEDDVLDEVERARKRRESVSERSSLEASLRKEATTPQTPSQGNAAKDTSASASPDHSHHRPPGASSSSTSSGNKDADDDSDGDDEGELPNDLNYLLLYPGGASEALLSSSRGPARILLRRRKGFLRLVLQTQSALVPVYTFGETDYYDQFGTSSSRYAAAAEDDDSVYLPEDPIAALTSHGSGAGSAAPSLFPARDTAMNGVSGNFANRVRLFSSITARTALDPYYESAIPSSTDDDVSEYGSTSITGSASTVAATSAGAAYTPRPSSPGASLGAVGGSPQGREQQMLCDSTFRRLSARQQARQRRLTDTSLAQERTPMAAISSPSSSTEQVVSPRGHSPSLPSPNASALPSRPIRRGGGGGHGRDGDVRQRSGSAGRRGGGGGGGGAGSGSSRRLPGWVERVQRVFQQLFGVSLPILKNIIPKRGVQARTVVGRPIYFELPPHLARMYSDPTQYYDKERERPILRAAQEVYIRELQELFHRYAPLYIKDPARRKLIVI